MTTRLSRPERNNNPGDIRASSGFTWRGQTGQDADGFAVFSHRLYGIRAMAILLNHYYYDHDCQTLRKIIERWSPPNENDTDNLIAKAAYGLEVDPDDYLVIEYVLPALIHALCIQEDSNTDITLSTIVYGMMLAQDYPA